MIEVVSCLRCDHPQCDLEMGLRRAIQPNRFPVTVPVTIATLPGGWSIDDDGKLGCPDHPRKRAPRIHRPTAREAIDMLRRAPQRKGGMG